MPQQTNETLPPLTLEQAHQIFFDQFNRVMATAGMSQAVLAESMLTVATANLLVATGPAKAAERLQSTADSVFEAEALSRKKSN